MKTILIQEGSERGLEKAINRLNRHAQKMGYAEAKVISMGIPFETKRTVLQKSEDGDVSQSRYAVRVREVVIDLPPQFENYEAAEWNVIGQIIRVEDGKAEIVGEPKQYKLISDLSDGFRWKCGDCGHGLGRAYVVQNKVDPSRLLMVGQECLKKYTGADGKAVLAAIEFLLVVEYKDGGEEGFGGGSGRRYEVIDLEDFLAVAIAVAEKLGGYTKRWNVDQYGERTENNLCTRNVALQHITAPSYNGSEPALVVTDAHRAAAEAKVEAWKNCYMPMRPAKRPCSGGDFIEGGVKTHYDSHLFWNPMQGDPTEVCRWCNQTRAVCEGPDAIPDDYVTQCKMIAERGWITEKTAGVAASMVKEPPQPPKDYSGSKHVGEIGKRQVFENLTVLNSIEREGAYGITTILKFEDPDGNILTWFASGSQGYQKGDKVSLKATVKTQDEYKGVKQTVISRAKEV